MESLVEQFQSITGAPAEVGRKLLDICNGSLEMAINMQLGDDGETGGILSVPAATPAGAGVVPQLPTDSATNTEASSSSIQNIAGPSTNTISNNTSLLSTGTTTSSSSSTIAAASTVDGSDDTVRAPIPQTRGVLVDGYQGYAPRRRTGPRSVFDGFRDFQAEAQLQEQQLRAVTPATRGAYQQVSKKQKTLEDLFRPPIDIMHKGTFNTARVEGQSRGFWLLVNVQNVKEFQCQVLNRDVWSNDSVRTILQEHFIFWQVYHDSEEGQRYNQFYKINHYPYIAILDPRTGEKLSVWNKLDAAAFCELVSVFLSEHPNFCVGSITPPNKKRRKVASIIDASEESQLEAAIAASLQETTSHSSTTIEGRTRIENLDDPYEAPHSDSDLESINVCSDSECFIESNTNSLDSMDIKMKSPSVTAAVIAKWTKATTTCVELSADNEEAPTESSTRTLTPRSPPTAVVAETHLPSWQQPASGPNGLSLSDSDPLQNSDTAHDRLMASEQNAQWNGTCHSAAETNETGTGVIPTDETTVEGPLATLLLRFPDGNRNKLTLPCSSKLSELISRVERLGYDRQSYELITRLPRRQLNEIEQSSTLEQAGLHPQETIFVQEK